MRRAGPLGDRVEGGENPETLVVEIFPHDPLAARALSGIRLAAVLAAEKTLRQPGIVDARDLLAHADILHRALELVAGIEVELVLDRLVAGDPFALRNRQRFGQQRLV